MDITNSSSLCVFFSPYIFPCENAWKLNCISIKVWNEVEGEKNPQPFRVATEKKIVTIKTHKYSMHWNEPCQAKACVYSFPTSHNPKVCCCRCKLIAFMIKVGIVDSNNTVFLNKRQFSTFSQLIHNLALFEEVVSSNCSRWNAETNKNNQNIYSLSHLSFCYLTLRNICRENCRYSKLNVHFAWFPFGIIIK